MRVLSLCSGIAGLDRGFGAVFPDARPLAYVENEVAACTILAARMEDKRIHPAPIWTDLKRFKQFAFRGMSDAIIGGYPCQGFSVAGKRRGTEDPRYLWPFIAELVESIRPRICVFENVRGHVRLGLSEVLGDLRSLGYRVRAGIFAASEVGAPHRRERVFILAIREGDGWIEGWAQSEGAEGRFDASECGSGLEHAASITERESNYEAATESREISRTVLGRGCEPTLADREFTGLQRHPRDGDRGNESRRQSENAHRSTAPGSASLGDTELRRCDARQPGNGRGEKKARRSSGPVSDRSNELGNPNSEPAGRDSRSVSRSQTQIREDGGQSHGSPHASGELVNTERLGRGGESPSEIKGIDQHFWPSRPGEPQHEWEEPRTINGKLNSAWVAQLQGFHSDWVEVPGLTREMKLRALGNAVVPAQAEFAIRSLLSEMSTKKPGLPPA